MQTRTQSILRRVILAVSAAACALLPVAASSQAREEKTPPALKILGEFLSVGGFFPTDSNTTRVFGNAKFYSNSTFYVRPAKLGPVRLTGGLEIVDISDHFFPFTGGNSYTLIGPSFHVSTPRKIGRVSPYLSAGLFLGNVRIDALGLDNSGFVPSLSFGVLYPINKVITLQAAYRISQELYGVNMDGFSINIRLF